MRWGIRTGWRNWWKKFQIYRRNRLLNFPIMTPAIRNIEFINSSIMFIYLDNDRTFIVPLDKFPAIQTLSAAQKKDYEIIDEHNLSFLAIDEIYSVNELIGL